MLFTSLRCTDMNVALKRYTCRSLKHCFDYLHTDLWIDHKPTHPQWVYLFCPFQSIYMFSVHPTDKDLQTLSVSALLSFLEDHPVAKICELRVFPVSHNLVVDSSCERRSFWECLYCWQGEVRELSLPSFHLQCSASITEQLCTNYNTIFLRLEGDVCLGSWRWLFLLQCYGHLGHVFDNGPTPPGQRICTNSVSLSFRLSSCQ